MRPVRLLGTTGSDDWTKSFYQHANRLAVLHFLTSHRVSARLVDVFFCGSTNSDDRSPATPEGWIEAIDRRSEYLGLTGESELEQRVHKVFIDVSGRA